MPLFVLMALAAKIDILLGANTRGLSKGFRRGTSLTKTFGNQIRLNNRTLMNAGGILARGATRVLKYGAAMATVAVGAATLMIKKQFQLIDATAKLSDRIGITVKDLMGLRHAAEITGVAADQLDAGLQVMQKRLGEVAIKGTGAAAPALKLLKLEADDLIRMAPDVAIKTIADAMGELETQSEKNAVTANIFSRANQNLVNTLALGSKGMDELQARSEYLRGSLSRVDAAGVEAANDAIHDLRQSISGLAERAAVELAPFVQVFAERLTSGVIAAREELENTSNSVGDLAAEFGLLGATIIRTTSGMESLTKAWLRWSIAFHESIKPGLTPFFQSWMEGYLPSGGMGEALSTGAGAGFIGALPRALGLVQEPLDNLTKDIEGMKSILDEMDTGTSWADQLMEDVRKANDAIRELRNESAAALGDDGAFSMPFEQSHKMLESWQRELDTFGMTARQKTIFDLEALLPKDDPFGRRDILGPLKDLDKELGLKESRRNLEAFADQINASVLTPFEKAQEAARKVGEALGEGLITEDTARNVLDEMNAKLGEAGRQFNQARRSLDFGGVGQGTQEAARRRFGARDVAEDQRDLQIYQLEKIVENTANAQRFERAQL